MIFSRLSRFTDDKRILRHSNEFASDNIMQLIYFDEKTIPKLIFHEKIMPFLLAAASEKSHA